ncbi:MAG TPA: stage 0 sporulation family protein [Geobacteraceae bacterium]|nr:stage 0 sporulation family protein [Geobacteraceae bacterium]
MARIVKIQFQTAGRLYDFRTGDLDITIEERVIVETERGKSIGLVVKGPFEIDDRDVPEGLKTVLRKAVPEDLESAARHRAKEKDAFDLCLRRIRERGMEMKLVKVEYLFDGSKAIFYFTADGRIDFRELVKDLAHAFHTRIEMRQIGVRDEAGMVGGLGICGRELCCSSFLREFEPVSVKMAKEQNLALNPTKISGQCGRLLCCLAYEFDTYCTLRKCLPKCGKRVSCGSVEGEVVKLNILDGTVTVKTDDNHEVIVRGDEVKVENTPERPKKPAKDFEETKPKKPQRGQQRTHPTRPVKERDENRDNAARTKEKP